MSDKDEAKDLSYMQNPDHWVQLLCPIKRWVGKQLECAYLLDGRPTIYKGNIWHPDPDKDEKQEYASHFAIVQDGWKVDRV